MMTSELTILLWVTTLTAVSWVPYILNRVMVLGIVDGMGYPENPKLQAPWAQRAQKAHYNAVENLVVFATLVLIANAVNVTNDTTVLACQIYFWARLVHYFVYMFGIPWVRTLAFAAGFLCQLTLVMQII
jgi:uncharacterized MAPEG superfamily protein